MMTYVFEDIDIGGGWRAMIAVGVNDANTAFVAGYMAFNEARNKFDDMAASDASVDYGKFPACLDWLNANRDNIPALHAEQMKKIRGRRALVKAVEGFDPVIGAQTRDVALRAVEDENKRPLTVQQLAAKLFPEIVCDGTNNDSPDADWRDGDRH